MSGYKRMLGWAAVVIFLCVVAGLVGGLFGCEQKSDNEVWFAKVEEALRAKEVTEGEFETAMQVVELMKAQQGSFEVPPLEMVGRFALSLHDTTAVSQYETWGFRLTTEGNGEWRYIDHELASVVPSMDVPAIHLISVSRDSATVEETLGNNLYVQVQKEFELIPAGSLWWAFREQDGKGGWKTTWDGWAEIDTTNSTFCTKSSMR